MKNITVSVDDETYHRARVRAAELRTSVSAIVKNVLKEVAAEETTSERLKRLERETIEQIRARGGKFSASTRLPREQIHDRNALR
jgi:plasmid stability protein